MILIYEYIIYHLFDIATTVFAFFIFRYEYKRLLVDKEQQYLDLFNELNESIDSIFLHLDKYDSMQPNHIDSRNQILVEVKKYALQRNEYLKILDTSSLKQIEKGLKELKTASVNIRILRSTLDSMLLSKVLENSKIEDK
jgi:hypothetical protein